jgi:threonine/homoserine/homoserine lactone efflux protein
VSGPSGGTPNCLVHGCEHVGVDLLEVLPAFLLAVLLISASPGPAMALILRRAALHGTRAAVPTVLGLEVGLYVWALAAGAGLAAVVAASEVAYTALRVVGAAVLLALGLRAWRSAWVDREHDRGHADPAPAPSDRTDRGAFLEGVLVQLANPKAAVFMFAFYPQFVPDEGPVLLWTACARAAAGAGRDLPLPGPGGGHRSRVGLVPAADDPPPAGGSQRHRPRRARPADRHHVALTPRPAPRGADRSAVQPAVRTSRAQHRLLVRSLRRRGRRRRCWRG